MASKILQFIWFITGVLALLVSIKNYLKLQALNHHVLVPLFICFFCVYLFFNIKRQRKEAEERKNKNK